MSSRRRRRGQRRRRDRPRREQPSPPSFLRRRSTRWLLAAVVTLAVGITLGVIAGTGGDDDGGSDGEEEPTPTLAVELPGLNADPARLQRAEIDRVIDGDTIDVRIDGRKERVRYFGVDTPERGDRCFNEATSRNEALAGDFVLLLPDVRERDSFDRLLRYVFSEGGESIEARLIAEGHGEAWREDGAYRDELVALEGEARDAGAGCLWE